MHRFLHLGIFYSPKTFNRASKLYIITTRTHWAHSRSQHNECRACVNKSRLSMHGMVRTGYFRNMLFRPQQTEFFVLNNTGFLPSCNCAILFGAFTAPIHFNRMKSAFFPIAAKKFTWIEAVFSLSVLAARPCQQAAARFFTFCYVLARFGWNNGFFSTLNALFVLFRNV